MSAFKIFTCGSGLLYGWLQRHQDGRRDDKSSNPEEASREVVIDSKRFQNSRSFEAHHIGRALRACSAEGSPAPLSLLGNIQCEAWI